MKPFSTRELLATLEARLEIARARRASEMRHALFERLYETIRPLRDPGEIVRAVTRVAGEHFGADRCSYSEVTPEGTHAMILSDFARGLPSIAGLHRADSYGTELIASMRAGNVIVVADTESDDSISTRARAAWRTIQTRGALIVPLVKDGRLVANFFLLTREPRAWQPAEVALAGEIAEQTWSALAAARSAEALQAAEERARRESAAQQALYDTALSNIPDFAYIFDLDARFMYLNRALAELLGRPVKEIVGKDFTELPYPPELAAKLTRQIHEVVATRQPVRDETPFTSPAGKPGLYEYIFTPAFDAEGHVTAVVGSTRDITAHVEANLALREADRRKDEFLAMLAHELRNPLASVTNAATLLREGADAKEQKWAADVIVRQSTQLARLVDDLLDVSRITRGKIELRRVRLDAALALDRARETVAPQIAAAAHTLLADYRPGELWLDADPTRLEQIVVNLLTNAARYTEPRGRIWLSARNENGEIVITVRDSGNGIPPDRIAAMFELFTQGERSSARSEGGLGIGLTVVRGLCELHGGSVHAHSEGTGRGSTFTVRLPAAPVPATTATHSAPSISGAPTGGARILIVDDNVDTAAGLSRLLARRGFSVAVARDGPAAIEKARAFSPAAVLLDIGLPTMDGYEVARRLRAETHDNHPFIVALSGYGQEADRARSREAGFDHHLIKPVDFEELRALLAAHVTPQTVAGIGVGGIGSVVSAS